MNMKRIRISLNLSSLLFCTIYLIHVCRVEPCVLLHADLEVCWSICTRSGHFQCKIGVKICPFVQVKCVYDSCFISFWRMRFRGFNFTIFYNSIQFKLQWKIGKLHNNMARKDYKQKYNVSMIVKQYSEIVLRNYAISSRLFGIILSIFVCGIRDRSKYAYAQQNPEVE